MKYCIEWEFTWDEIHWWSKFQDCNEQDLQFFLMDWLPSIFEDLLNDLAIRLKKRNIKQIERLYLLQSAAMMSIHHINSYAFKLLWEISGEDKKEWQVENFKEFNLFDKLKKDEQD